MKSQAIQTALSGDWRKAIELNSELLKENPDDLDTLNRLAHAYAALGKIKEAKNTYQQVLKLDTKNPIALRNIKRLVGNANSKNNGSPTNLHMLSTMFLEESGKTKVVELVNVAEPKIISSFSPGEIVHIRVKRMKVFVLDEKNHYIGMLPDNVGKRLLVFLKGGNSYDAFIKSIQNHNISIFIKETKKAYKFRNQPSFALFEKTKTKLDKPAASRKEKEENQELDDEDESEES